MLPNLNSVSCTHEYLTLLPNGQIKDPRHNIVLIDLLCRLHHGIYWTHHPNG